MVVNLQIQTSLESNGERYYHYQVAVAFLILTMRFEETPNEATFLASRKCERHLIDHHKVFVGISGGSDSDIVIDLLEKVLAEKSYDYDCEVHYVFFDTGIEYEATKRHIDYLEQKYGIKIERIRAKVPVPLGIKEFGVPFLAKYTSEMIDRLQKHNFDFANDGNKSFEELMAKYPNCQVALQFWCNANPPTKKGEPSRHNIKRHFALKEFMIANPPTFRISQECCNGAKKENGHDYIEENNCDLSILGLRKDEDGIRSTNIHSCYSQSEDGGCDSFRLIWWFTDKDKQTYKKKCAIQNSDCYEVYGLTRTGCAGCPFGSKWENELKVIEKYEPKLYKAVWNIFGESYEYTRKYREFKREYKWRLKHGYYNGQMCLLDLLGEQDERIVL